MHINAFDGYGEALQIKQVFMALHQGFQHIYFFSPFSDTFISVKTSAIYIQ